MCAIGRLKKSVNTVRCLSSRPASPSVLRTPGGKWLSLNSKINESRTIKHYHYEDWLEAKSPASAVDIIDVIGVLQKAQNKGGGGPIIVHDKYAELLLLLLLLCWCFVCCGLWNMFLVYLVVTSPQDVSSEMRSSYFNLSTKQFTMVLSRRCSCLNISK